MVQAFGKPMESCLLPFVKTAAEVNEQGLRGKAPVKPVCGVYCDWQRSVAYLCGFHLPDSPHLSVLVSQRVRAHQGIQMFVYAHP
jgi:hypothetical protein